MNRRDWHDQNETRDYDHEERGRHDAQGDHGRDDSSRYRMGDAGHAGERHDGSRGYGPYRRDTADADWDERNRGGYDPYREGYYGLPGGFYGGIPGGHPGMGRYDRGRYADREFYGRNRDIRGAYRDHDPDRGFLARATDEVSSWFGDEDAERRREQDHRGRGPKNYQRSDLRVEEDVNDRLTDDHTLDASDIAVQVKDREVTLDGTVQSRYAKRRAEDCADSVSGVQHVQNNLRVQEPDNRSTIAAANQENRH